MAFEVLLYPYIKSLNWFECCTLTFKIAGLSTPYSLCGKWLRENGLPQNGQILVCMEYLRHIGRHTHTQTTHPFLFLPHNKWNVRTMHNKNTLNLPILGNLEILPKGIVFMVRSIWKLNVSQRQHQNAHATLLLLQSTSTALAAQSVASLIFYSSTKLDDFYRFISHRVQTHMFVYACQSNRNYERKQYWWMSSQVHIFVC